MAGSSDVAGGNAIRATLWNGATATDLGTLGGAYSFANAINDAGQVVGYAQTTDNAVYHATLWSGATAPDLNSFLDASTVSAGWVLENATGINDQGWIVGNASNAQLGITSHAFLLSTTPVPELDTATMMLSGLVLTGFVMRRRKPV